MPAGELRTEPALYPVRPVRVPHGQPCFASSSRTMVLIVPPSTRPLN